MKKGVKKITYNDHQQGLLLPRQKFVLINSLQVLLLQQRHTVVPWLLVRPVMIEIRQLDPTKPQYLEIGKKILSGRDEPGVLQTFYQTHLYSIIHCQQVPWHLLEIKLL